MFFMIDNKHFIILVWDKWDDIIWPDKLTLNLYVKTIYQSQLCKVYRIYWRYILN